MNGALSEISAQETLAGGVGQNGRVFAIEGEPNVQPVCLADLHAVTGATVSTPIKFMA